MLGPVLPTSPTLIALKPISFWVLEGLHPATFFRQYSLLSPQPEAGTSPSLLKLEQQVHYFMPKSGFPTDALDCLRSGTATI